MYEYKFKLDYVYDGDTIYGRVLAEVLANEQNVNSKMLALSLAVKYE